MSVLLEKDLKMEQLAPLIQERLAAGQTVRFSPRGVSMRPMLREGIDSVILSPVPEKLKQYDLPLYRRENGQYVLHRVIRAGDTYTCIGDNQMVLEPGVNHDQMIAIVSGFFRGKNYHSVKEPGYWIYCRVWYLGKRLRRFLHRGIRWLKRHLKGK